MALSQGPKNTFGLQDSLPKLPVPPLDQSLDNYLESVSVFQTPSEHEATRKAVERFRTVEGPQLQRLLEARAKEKDNWLEEWWEEFAYLRLRVPLVPFVNFGGSSQDVNVWPPKVGSAYERAAIVMHFMMQYWEQVRREKVPVTKNRDTPWCMEQKRRMFSSCRIPGEEKDELVFQFKTEKEGRAKSHVVVFCNGRAWKIETKDRSGKILTAPALEAGLRHISTQSASPGPYVNSLTCLDRTSWWKVRQHLIALDSNNAHYFHLIESAVAVFSFTDHSPETDNELAQFSIAGDAKSMYAGKCLNYHIHRNGMISTCSEHALIDAIVQMQMCSWVDEEIANMGYAWNGEKSYAVLPEIKELDFTLDRFTLDKVREAQDLMDYNRNLITINVLHVSDMGVDFFKPYRIYGDTVVQLALQLSYIRLHGKPASTYETASTRKFFRARTETVRSCTCEAVEFSKAFIAYGPTPEVYELFETAMNRQNQMMLLAMEGQGFDRHLFGLKILAVQQGMEPEMFKDPGWTLSGGDGNFVLSTSFVGYSNVWGGVAPMRADGYGTFYKMNPNRISFYISIYNDSPETNLEEWKIQLLRSLNDIKCLIERYKEKRNSSKL